MAGLVVLAPPAQGVRLELNEQHATVIGREGFCDLVLTKRTISRKHARVFFNGEHYVIEDLGSTHGTFLNGQRLSAPRVLSDGDRINIFDVPVVFCRTNGVIEGETSEFTLSATQAAGFTLPAADAPRSSVTSAPGGRLQNLQAVTRSLGSSLTLDEIFPRVLDLLFSMFPQATVGEIQVVDDCGKLSPVAMKHGRLDDSSVITRVPVGNDLARRVFESRQRLLKTVEACDKESILDDEGSCILCVPIIGPSQVGLGTILLESADVHRGFTQDEVELLETIGILTGQAIEYSQAHQTLLQLDQTQRDLQLARQLQTRMLPHQRPSIPGYDFASHYTPADSVGSDFYMWDTLPNDRVVLAVADACGRSLPAALLMAQFSSELRHCLATAETFREAMASLNRFVYRMNEGYITLCLCLLDSRTHVLTVMNAGHLSPRCRRYSTGTVDLLEPMPSSLPLGLENRGSFHSRQTTLHPGDEVFLLSDGLIEAMAPNNCLYGTDRFDAVIARSQSSLTQRINEVVADVTQFRAGRRLSDDCCLIGFSRQVD
jgi:serine phosphatase RsbU (regulator of sigma subunit)